MVVNKYSVTAVEYLNTVLFVDGLRRSDVFSRYFSLMLDHPAGCTERMLSGQADIGLVPVASLEQIKPLFIFGSYCIGAHEAVRTVRLLANQPLKKLRRIFLDSHSRTSVRLLDILSREFWGVSPEFVPAEPGFEFEQHAEDCGILVIGDKVFQIEDSYPYSYDLAEEWISYTSKDFVFAVWASKVELTDELIGSFHAALTYGLNNRDQVISEMTAKPKYYGVDVRDYLSRNISYPFDQLKREGMELFLDLAGLNNFELRYK